jgi:tRNA threonylcarbamoyladenosine biosynthesis protein TsaE
MKPALEIKIGSVAELPQAAKALLEAAGNTTIFLFHAEMGAGKTTLIKALCKSLGSTDNFSSPTYSIVNEYSYPGGKIFHFDLYRLKNSEELFDLGIEEYLRSGQYCFFEWPELVREILGDNYLEVNIIVNENIRYLRATQF